MKFLFITHWMHPNLYGWVDTLVEKGHTVRFLGWRKQLGMSDTGVRPEHIERSSIEKWVPRVWKQPGKWFRTDSHTNVPKISSLYKTFKEYNPDVLVTQNPNIWSIPFISILLARIRGCQILVYLETPLYKKRNIWKVWFIRVFTVLFRVTWFTSISGDARNPPLHPNAQYVPLVMKTGHSGREVSTENSGVMRIMTVGKLDLPRKNILLLLHALNELKSTLSFRLVIIGVLQDESDPVYEKIQKYIQEHDLQQRVTIKKNVDRSEVLHEYTQNDLFVLPSSNEPFGFSVLEAMSRGLPVICSDTTGVQWSVEHGGNGYIFKSNDSDDLQECIRTAVSSSEQLQKMGARSRELIQEEHSPEAFYTSFIRMLKHDESLTT
ncbi:MAG: glycosyltransferase family 4 protein [Candidatus Paceibacterota bacterium]